MVEVTQADREAAADVLDEVCSLIDHNGIGQVADLIRDGEYDEHPCVQRIAAHRLAERERCARVAEDWTMDWTRESAHVPSDIAQAIRSGA